MAPPETVQAVEDRARELQQAVYELSKALSQDL